MGATRRLLAATRHWTKSAAGILPALRKIGSIAPTALLPTIALLPAAGGWMDAARGARVKALSFVVASALCASPAWSADRVAKSSSMPAGYFLPRCDNPAVINQIGAEFPGRHWSSGFAAVGMRDARKFNQDYWPPDMPRHFCEGKIELLRSGDERTAYYPIYYAVIADGPSYQVAWCVVGVDREWFVDPRCRLARP